MDKQIRRFRGALLGVATMFGIASLVGCHTANPHPASQPVVSAANNPAPQGLAPAEWTKLKVLYIHLDRTQTLSDSDIAFVAHILHTKPTKDTPQNVFARQQHTLAQLVVKKPIKWSNDQAARFYDIVLPYVSSPNQVVQCNAIIALTSTRDPRAIPVFEHLVKSSPNMIVRDIASADAKRLRLSL